MSAFQNVSFVTIFVLQPLRLRVQSQQKSSYRRNLSRRVPAEVLTPRHTTSREQSRPALESNQQQPQKEAKARPAVAQVLNPRVRRVRPIDEGSRIVRLRQPKQSGGPQNKVVPRNLVDHKQSGGPQQRGGPQGSGRPQAIWCQIGFCTIWAEQLMDEKLF